jgi:hypothetical protein
MTVHQYEARCACGATWRVYFDEDDEDPCGTCLNCGQVTYDLTDIGEPRSAGPGTV